MPTLVPMSTLPTATVRRSLNLLPDCAMAGTASSHMFAVKLLWCRAAVVPADLGYNEASQALMYEAFFKAVYPQPWFQGVFFWAWLTNPDDTGKTGDAFTPSGRLAATVMKTFFTKNATAV